MLRELAEAFDSPGNVHAVAVPAGDCCLGIDRQSQLLVRAFQLGRADAFRRAVLGRRRELSAIGGVKPDAFVVACHGEAAFVDEAVVIAAEKHEILQTGGAAVGPVDDVVTVDVAALGAARKTTAVVAQA